MGNLRKKNQQQLDQWLEPDCDNYSEPSPSSADLLDPKGTGLCLISLLSLKLKIIVFLLFKEINVTFVASILIKCCIQVPMIYGPEHVHVNVVWMQAEKTFSLPSHSSCSWTVGEPGHQNSPHKFERNRHFTESMLLGSPGDGFCGLPFEDVRTKVDLFRADDWQEAIISCWLMERAL